MSGEEEKEEEEQVRKKGNRMVVKDGRWGKARTSSGARTGNENMAKENHVCMPVLAYV